MIIIGGKKRLNSILLLQQSVLEDQPQEFLLILIFTYWWLLMFGKTKWLDYQKLIKPGQSGRDRVKARREQSAYSSSLRRYCETPARWALLHSTVSHMRYRNRAESCLTSASVSAHGWTVLAGIVRTQATPLKRFLIVVGCLCLGEVRRKVTQQSDSYLPGMAFQKHASGPGDNPRPFSPCSGRAAQNCSSWSLVWVSWHFCTRNIWSQEAVQDSCGLIRCSLPRFRLNAPLAEAGNLLSSGKQAWI